MATRIETILLRARDTLADPNQQRWSDDRLLRLVDEGQRDIAKHTKILKGQYEFVLQIDVSNYTLPDNVWLITRATFNSSEIPLYSYDRMDEQVKKEALSDYRGEGRERNRGYNTIDFDLPFSGRWELDTGAEVTALIFDNRNVNDIRVYPIPNDSIAQNNYTFTSDDSDFAGGEYFGVVTALSGDPEYTFDSAFGVLTGLFDPQIETETFSPVFGVTSNILDSSQSMNIFYIRTPAVISTIEDELEIPTMFDVAIKHYVVANAFRDDLDVQYRDMGAESFKLYNRELALIQETNRTDGTRNATVSTTTYRGGFE